MIITNYSVGGVRIEEIKDQIMKEVNGLKGCEVYGEDWIISTINNNIELKRDIPRMYGIGDMTSILDERVMRSSGELLKHWEENIKTFIPTNNYIKALESLKRNKFLMITGGPQTGKTVIAQNLCLTIIQEDSEYVVLSLKIDNFMKHYNSNDQKRVYFFNDIFGEQSIYNLKVENLSEGFFENLQAAIQNGCYVICTCRDYVFNQVEDNGRIQKSTRSFTEIMDKRYTININMDDYTLKEKKRILYRHIKNGDLPKEIKTKIKPFLSQIAAKEEFRPELARRLSNHFYSKSLTFDFNSVNDFFENPIDFLQSVFRELEESEKAAMILILLKNGRLPFTIINKHLDERILKIYDVKPVNITRALKNLKGSLISQDFVAGQTIWTPYHPSMKEALVDYFEQREEMMEIFISLADFETLVHKTSILNSKGKIFVSEDSDLWELLSKRLFSSLVEERWRGGTIFEDSYLFRREKLVEFFLKETSEEFLLWFERTFGDSQKVWRELTTESVYEQLHSVDTFEFGYRLINSDLLEPQTKELISKRILKIAQEKFDISFLNDEAVIGLLSDHDLEYLINYYYHYGAELAESELINLEDNFNSYSSNIEQELEEYLEHWTESVEFLRSYLLKNNKLTDQLSNNFMRLWDEMESWKEQIIEQHEMEIQEVQDEEVNRGIEALQLIYDLLSKSSVLEKENNFELVDETISEIIKIYDLTYIEVVQVLIELVNSRFTSFKETSLYNYLMDKHITLEDIFSDVDE
ncbi:nSTAND3 domain-containing NTPase [Paenibacillus tundrae]